MNVAVIFYSLYGNTAALARAVAVGAEQAGATVRLRRVPELASEDQETASRPASADDRAQSRHDRLSTIPLVASDDLIWADGAVFGSPTRYGNMCAQLKHFFDETDKLELANELVGKVAGVFCSMPAHRGEQQSTLISMMLPLLNLGFLIQGLPCAEAEQISRDEVHGGSCREAGLSALDGPQTAHVPTRLDLTLSRGLGHRIAVVAGRLRALD